jgi:hypothetical protein
MNIDQIYYTLGALYRGIEKVNEMESTHPNLAKLARKFRRAFKKRIKQLEDEVDRRLEEQR